MRILTLLVAGLMTASMAWADTIYRYRDASGRILYTDQPRPGAEAVKPPALSTYQPADAPPPPIVTEAEDTAGAHYDSLVLVQPSAGETIHSNPGDVPITVSLLPPLRVDAGHRIGVRVDGQAVAQTSDSPSFTLHGLDRGSHTLQAMVLDDQGRPLMETDPIEFYVWQASVNFPTRQTAP